VGVEPILRRQGRKIARAWFDAEFGRLESFRNSLETADSDGVIFALERMGKSVYLERLRKTPERWSEELEAILSLPPTSAAFLEVRKSELHYRAKRISPGLYRSCQPHLEHLQQLAQGISLTQVINLREESQVSREHCEKAGLDYHFIPVVDHGVPTVEQVEEFLQLLQTGVSLIHCLAGRGRTGIFVACYRIRSGMEPVEALAVTEREVRPIRPHQQEWVLAFR
jgi:protein tyrosine phosphatase (PTP) superfamily phosphohydrolase (DUF442 family)